MRLQLVWERKEHFYWSINAWQGVKVFPSEDGAGGGGGGAGLAWWRNDKAEIPPACAGSLGSPDYEGMSKSVTQRHQTMFLGKHFGLFTGSLGFLLSA